MGTRLTSKEVAEAVRRVMEEFEITEWIIEQPGTRHPRVRFKAPNGRELKYAVASSPSDFRGHMATRTMLRRLCRENAGPRGDE